MRTRAPTQSLTVDHHDDDIASDDSPVQEKRRKGTGGLRVSQNQSSFQEDLSEHQRQMQVDSRSFPKRKKVYHLPKRKPGDTRGVTLCRAAYLKCPEDIQAIFIA
jgi:hypothetical protein